jgi:trehalose-phosphatase
VDQKHEWFFDAVAAQPRRVLLLDYDGTIAPFCRDRSRAVPYPGVAKLLSQISNSCRTRLIIVSGRSAHEVGPLLGMNPSPEIWGAYGLEQLHADGIYEQMEVAEAALDLLDRTEEALEREGLGHLTEVRHAAVAVHWRGFDQGDILKIRTRAYGVLEPLAFQPGLLLSEFEGGIEVRLRSANKGDALRNLLEEIPSGVPVAYVGDDASDEDAFRILNGRGLTVLVRPRFRFTAAQLWLRPPDELTSFLKDWIRACGVDS